MEPVKLEGNEIEEVKTFTYLDSIIDKHGGTDADVKAMFGNVRGACIRLKNIWSSKELSLYTKICLFNSNCTTYCMEQRHGGQLTSPPRKHRPLSITV